jgi:hypothetical protein
MNAYRKLIGILAIGALTCGAGGLSPAFGQGHNSGGHAGSGGGHAHYAAGGHGGVGGAHYAAGYRGGAYGRGGAYYGRGGAYSGRGGYGRGGYWHGGYGPRFGFGWGWFLPVLPAFYATYWFGGIPYYYANDAYYTWSPDYNGYVMSDPPAAAVPQDNDAAPPPPANGQSFNYPKNGQTDEQQASDRYQCHQWAVSQSGYDPTRNGAGAAAGQQNDYHRALTACMEGRGYSVR